MADPKKKTIEYFHSLVDLAPDEQQRKLDDLPLNDQQRRELADLLRADAGASSAFLADPPQDDGGDNSTLDHVAIDTSTSGRAAEARQPQPETMLGEYRLVKLLGEGAFGSVWEAHDTKLDRPVAIKIPKRVDDEERQRLLREAQAVAQLKHRHLLTVYRVEDGAEYGHMFVVTDLATGGSLQEKLARESMPPREAARFVAKLASALACAHGAEIIHRDLKPDNILLDGAGEPLIADFGLAKRLSADETRTMAGMVLGTPAYMSPEQAKGDSHKADARSDIFSLGVILYEMLTGERPFRGSTRMVIEQIIADDPPDPRRLNYAIAKDLANICLKCLGKHPGSRYATAAELQEDLDRWLNGQPVVARPVGAWGKFSRWCQRHPALATLSTLFVLSLIVGITVSSLLAWRADKRAKQLLRLDTAQQMARHAQKLKTSEPRLSLRFALEAVELSQREGESVHELVEATLRDVCSEMHPTELLVDQAQHVALADGGAFYSGDQGLFWQPLVGEKSLITRAPVSNIAATKDGRLATRTQAGIQQWKHDGDGWQKTTDIPLSIPSGGSQRDTSVSVTHLAISPNGRHVVTYHNADNQIRRFDLDDAGTVTGQWSTDAPGLVTLEVGDSGFAWASWSSAVWYKHDRDHEAQGLLGFNPTHEINPHIAIAPDERRIAVSHYNETYVRDVSDGTIGNPARKLELYPRFGDAPSFITLLDFFSPDRLVVGGGEGWVISNIYLTHSNASRRNFDNCESELTCMASSSNTIVYGTTDGAVWLSVRGNRLRVNRCLNGAVEDLHLLDRNGQRVLAISGDKSVRIWAYEEPDIVSVEVLHSKSDYGGGRRSEISPDGDWMVVYSGPVERRRTTLISARTKQEVVIGTADSAVTGSAFSSDARFHAAALDAADEIAGARIEIRALLPTGPKLVYTSAVPGRVHRLAWSSGATLTGYSWSGQVVQWNDAPGDVWTGPVSASVSEIDEKMIAFSDKHDRIVIGLESGLTLLERKQGFRASQLADGKSHCCAVGASGTFVAGLQDNGLKIVNLATGAVTNVEELIDLSEPSLQTAVAFSPDERWLAVGHKRSLRLGFRSDSGWVWHPFELDEDIAYLQFAPDGESLYATEMGGKSDVREGMVCINLGLPLEMRPVPVMPGTIFMRIDDTSSRMVTWGLGRAAGFPDAAVMLWDLTSPRYDRVTIWEGDGLGYLMPQFLKSGKIALTSSNQQVYVVDPDQIQSLDGWVKRAKVIADQPLTPQQRATFQVPE